MATKLGRMVSYLRRLPPTKLPDSWQHGLARSPAKLKSLYLHYHGSYDRRTWQVGYLSREAFSHMILNQLVLLDHVIIWKFTLQLSQDLWPLNLAGCSLWGQESVSKRLSRLTLTSFFFLFHLLRNAFG